ncbi:precorrin-2 C(20)-methyltransferase [Geminocystis sp. NIES-3709]|uniref:precorrin-2 C(20)-methyltransferase n=1 Tax=Geminocystis sp. NIES-3709 TaxID=1617448 RepID=UPI0005FCD4EB|nr:precorrin-2 C(20)-methyltransferase [Geminocystis sp. NIES-3709]BAQ65894.1 cobalt-precorrin-2 C20-methyltransferase [Geminocystis sp. NIES-3709]
MKDKIGTLYGVSVGTGDPELITIKALKIIQQTKIIAFPAGINNRLGIAETIIQGYLQPHQKKLPLSFPYTISQNILTQAWHDVSTQVWQYLKNGEDVAFVCEGDISFYSTFTYLALTIQKLYSEVKIQRIAGVSSPMASASVLGLPLTIQEEKLIILPALYSVKHLEEALDWAEVVVLMKVASVYNQVWKTLAQRDLFDRSYLVEKATTDQEKVYTCLNNYPELKLSYFSILIIYQRKVNNEGFII